MAWRARWARAARSRRGRNPRHASLVGEPAMTIEQRVDALERRVTRYRGATMALVGKEL